MACMRKRIKRGMCFVLACYVTFLLLSVNVWSGGSLASTSTGSESGISVKDQQASLVKKDLLLGQDQNDVVDDGDLQGGSEKPHPNSLLLPEDLDLAIQQQPGPAVRKKLSRPQPQQLNVVVEDAPPGTFVKEEEGENLPDSDPDFNGLQRGPPAPSNRRFQELRFVGEREKGDPHGLNSNRKKVDDPLRRGEGRANAEGDGNTFIQKEAQPELVPEKQNKAVWVAPDGSPDDWEAEASFNNKQLHPRTTIPDVVTPAPPLTAAMLNITVSKTAANFKEIADVSIYSAFYDDRMTTPHVRMVAVGPISRRPATSELWCVFSGSQSLEPVKVLFHQTSDCKRMKKYCFYMLSCQVPPGAHFSASKSDNSLVVVIGKRENNFLNQSGERLRLDVIVNPKRSANQITPYEHPSASPLFSVCVPPLFGKLNVLQFVEFVELNRLLGAVHFTFYKFRVTREIARVLLYYEGAGVARVLPWSLPAPNDVWYKGQGVAMGDCLYRNMHLFNFVAMQDLDEFFIPTTVTSWREMFEDIQEQSENVDTIAAVYQLSPVLFYAGRSAKELTNQKSPSGVQAYSAYNSEASKFLTLKSTFRAKGVSSNLTKMFVKPERVLELDSHTLVKPVSDSFVAYKVDTEMGSVHHYRYLTCDQVVVTPSNNADCEHLFQNRTVWKFADDLIWRTKKVLQELNRLGTSLI